MSFLFVSAQIRKWQIKETWKEYITFDIIFYFEIDWVKRKKDSSVTSFLSVVI